MLRQGVFFLLFYALLAYASSTPLDDYVNAYDDHYNYSLIKTFELTGYKLYILNMTSQKWYDGI